MTLDTFGVVALVNRLDAQHREVRTALLEDGGPYLVPAGILGEVGYMLERRAPRAVLRAFLRQLDRGPLKLDCGENDFERILELVERYANLPLGFADAAVIACAERNGGRVLTLDQRDFYIVSGEGRITVLPA